MDCLVRSVCLMLLTVRAFAASADDLPPLRLVIGIDRIVDSCNDIRFAILDEALRKRSHIQFVCEALPWARAQLMVREGSRDGMVTLNTAERARYAVASLNEVINVHMVAFTSARHPQLERMKKARSLDDLKEFRLITYIGNGWQKAKLEPLGFTIESALDMSAVLHMLEKGRGDLIIDGDFDTVQQIRALHLEHEIIMLPLTVETIPMHLLINRQSAYVKLLPKIDRALDAMKQDGTLEKISARYR